MKILLADYRMMLRIRLFEQAVEDMFMRGAIHGTTHLCIGQEAVPVGISSLLTSNDLTLSNHRGHGHFLARGASTARLFAELMGKVDGYCRGKGGTQHLHSLEVGHLGSNGITAGTLPVAAGAALSAKHLGTGAIVVAYFGDGAVGEGVWHETMNIASLWKLPILFVCENNLYAMSTPISKGIAGKSVAVKAASFDIPWAVVDGNDVSLVRETAKPFIEAIRSQEGPAFIEALTYRQRGHSKSDGREYRTSEEEQQWLEKDPLTRVRDILNEKGAMDDVDAIFAEISNEIAAAIEFARNSPFPVASEAFAGIFAGGASDER